MQVLARLAISRQYGFTQSEYMKTPDRIHENSKVNTYSDACELISPPHN